MYNIVDFNTYAGKFLNVDSNKVKGVELGVQYHFNEKVNVGGNFSFAEKIILQQDCAHRNKEQMLFRNFTD